jgi:hypothetical protein
MTTQQTAPARRRRDGRSDAIVAALVERGLVPLDHQDEAAGVVDQVIGSQQAGAAPLRRRFAEIAGYVGAAFVVSAAVIFFATQWRDLSEGQQVGLLAGVGVLLGLAGLAIGGLALDGHPGGFRALRDETEAVRRRLAGVLFVGAAATAAGAAGLQVEYMGTREYSELPAVVGFATFVVLALGGYLLARSVFGQVAVAGGVLALVPTTWEYVGSADAIPVGLTFLAIGLVWLVLAETGAWHETATARVVGSALAVLGAQIPIGSDQAWIGYLVTLLVAGAGFAAYVVRRAWPYLAVGVVGVTLAVPEALLDWTEGSLGPAGVLLVAGVSLLGASLLGLRLRHEVADDSA